MVSVFTNVESAQPDIATPLALFVNILPESTKLKTVPTNSKPDPAVYVVLASLVINVCAAQPLTALSRVVVVLSIQPLTELTFVLVLNVPLVHPLKLAADILNKLPLIS